MKRNEVLKILERRVEDQEWSEAPADMGSMGLESLVSNVLARQNVLREKSNEELEAYYENVYKEKITIEDK